MALVRVRALFYGLRAQKELWGLMAQWRQKQHARASVENSCAFSVRSQPHLRWLTDRDGRALHSTSANGILLHVPTEVTSKFLTTHEGFTGSQQLPFPWSVSSVPSQEAHLRNRGSLLCPLSSRLLATNVAIIV